MEKFLNQADMIDEGEEVLKVDPDDEEEALALLYDDDEKEDDDDGMKSKSFPRARDEWSRVHVTLD